MPRVSVYQLTLVCVQQQQLQQLKILIVICNFKLILSYITILDQNVIIYPYPHLKEGREAICFL